MRILLLVTLIVASGCSGPQPPELGSTGYYQFDTPSSNWNVGEVVAIYIGKNTPYKVSSILDPRISDLDLSEGGLTISESQEVERIIKADLNADLEPRLVAEFRASGRDYRKSVLSLSNITTVDLPHTEIIKALREGGLSPNSIECEYISDLKEKGILIDVLESLIVADATITLRDSSGVEAALNADVQGVIEAELGLDLQQEGNSSLVAEGLVVGYKKDPNLLDTARRSCDAE